MASFDEEMTRGREIGALHPGPSVAGHSIQYNKDKHAWIIDQTLVVCSLPEYRCLKLLLEHADRCVPFAHFVNHLQETPISDTALLKQEKLRVAHVMSNLRTKIWALGLDIASVMNVGYILLSDAQKDHEPPL